MRLWHKDLIELLPRQQLLGQWRECCLIAKNIQEKGIPGHILVNKVMNYPIQEFINYTGLVYEEMANRGYKVDWNKFICYIPNKEKHRFLYQERAKIFHNWHDSRYLRQCYFNLQEKYDCGGIPEDDWVRIKDFVKYFFGTNYISV